MGVMNLDDENVVLVTNWAEFNLRRYQLFYQYI